VQKLYLNLKKIPTDPNIPQGTAGTFLHKWVVEGRFGMFQWYVGVFLDLRNCHGKTLLTPNRNPNNRNYFVDILVLSIG